MAHFLKLIAIYHLRAFSGAGIGFPLKISCVLHVVTIDCRKLKARPWGDIQRQHVYTNLVKISQLALNLIMRDMCARRENTNTP
jgi:hypothetical protein